MRCTNHIVIIGGGFCGTITAVHLLKNAQAPLQITLVNSGSPFIRGIAYSPYSPDHLLNVAAENMSAFAGDELHFVEWLSGKNPYSEYEKDVLNKSFISRKIYGDYLQSIWETTLAAKKSDVELRIIEDYAADIELQNDSSCKVILAKGAPLYANYIVLATGNSLPRNPAIDNMDYYAHPTYYRNPWNIDSVNHLKTGGDIFIIGNGLTMVDTVMGLIENKFRNKIYSLSGNGFGILPHRNSSVPYKGLVAELENNYQLLPLFHLIKKHIKKVRKPGISAGVVIDSLRPYSQQIWQSFTPDEKKQFLSRFRHLWGVARHRLPVMIYDTIRKLQSESQLEIIRGKLLNITEKENEALVTLYNSRKQCNETYTVQRVINCTGPETNIHETANSLLQKLASKSIISPDPLRMGIQTDVSTYRVIDAYGEQSPFLFTLGTNLKGLVWETVAVPELRVQCEQLSAILLNACKK